MLNRCPHCRRLDRAARKEPTRIQGRTRFEEKAEKKAREKSEARELKRLVFARAEDTCELCGIRRAADLHHLLPGSGRRREMQAVENTMALCRICHEGYHARPQPFSLTIIAWCLKYGYPVPGSVARRSA